jgi:hypothetical protein
MAYMRRGATALATACALLVAACGDQPQHDAKADRTKTIRACVNSGAAAYGTGTVDPYWRREGKADYVAFLRETCRRAYAAGAIKAHQGALTKEQRAKLDRIYAQVLREMVRDGRVAAP